jgi:hypothetical protein
MKLGKHRKRAFKKGDHVQWAGQRYGAQGHIFDAVGEFYRGPFVILAELRQESHDQPCYILQQINPEGPEFECCVEGALVLADGAPTRTVDEIVEQACSLPIDSDCWGIGPWDFDSTAFAEADRIVKLLSSEERIRVAEYRRDFPEYHKTLAAVYAHCGVQLPMTAKLITLMYHYFIRE